MFVNILLENNHYGTFDVTLPDNLRPMHSKIWKIIKICAKNKIRFLEKLVFLSLPCIPFDFYFTSA